jgi:uncharacterized protein (DUF58 family)
LSQTLRSTERLASLFLIAAIFISTGSFPTILLDFAGYARFLIVAGVFLILLSLSMMGYAIYTLNKIMGSEIRVGGDIGFEGEELEVSYSICSRSLYPLLFIELMLRYPDHLRLVRGSGRALIAIPPRGCVVYRAWFEGRVGRHIIGPLRAVVRDPLGLFRSDEIEIGGLAELRVFPRYVATSYRKSRALSRAIGIMRSRVAGGGAEFLSVREYREGDEPRRVVWRHTARWGKLIVKETEKEVSAGIVYIVPIDGRAFKGPYRETPFEISSRIIATLARISSHRGDRIALIAFGKGLLDIVTPARGVEGYRGVVSALSRIEFTREREQPGEEDYLKLLKSIARHIGGGSIVLLFLYPAMDPKHASRLAEIVSKLVATSGGSIYAVIPTPDAETLSKKDLASKLETLNMIRGSHEITRSLLKRGIPATPVSHRNISKLATMIELSTA